MNHLTGGALIPAGGDVFADGGNWKFLARLGIGDNWAAAGVYTFNRTLGKGIGVLSDAVLDTAVHFAHTISQDSAPILQSDGLRRKRTREQHECAGAGKQSS